MVTSSVYGSNCLYLAAIVLDTYNLFILMNIRRQSVIIGIIYNKTKLTITENEELLIIRVSCRVNCNYLYVHIVYHIFFFNFNLCTNY